jgi:hypothetical protein
MFLPNKEAKANATVAKIGFADSTEWTAHKPF